MNLVVSLFLLCTYQKPHNKAYSPMIKSPRLLLESNNILLKELPAAAAEEIEEEEAVANISSITNMF
jgi:hypothetical protein